MSFPLTIWTGPKDVPDAKKWTARAAIAHLKGEYAEAERDYFEALRADRDSLYAHIGLARTAALSQANRRWA